MNALTGKRILLVGAQGGLGRHIADRLHDDGAHVIGTARAPQPGSSSTSVDEWRPLDLASAESIATLLDEFDGDSTSPPLDGVFVAAGVVGFGPAIETPAALFEQLVTINASGVIRLITGLIPSLSSTSGFIATISGQIVDSPTLGLSAYGASKSMLAAFRDSASREFRRVNVRWFDARPGHTETGLADRALFGTAPSFPAGLDPRSVANRIVDGIINDERDLVDSDFRHIGA